MKIAVELTFTLSERVIVRRQSLQFNLSACSESTQLFVVLFPVAN